MFKKHIQLDEQVQSNRLARAAQRGATLVEYALLVALIAIVAATAVGFLGNGTSARFESITVPIRD